MEPDASSDLPQKTSCTRAAQWKVTYILQSGALPSNYPLPASSSPTVPMRPQSGTQAQSTSCLLPSTFPLIMCILSIPLGVALYLQ